MTTLPGWMRGALFATAVMNVAAAAGFMPSARGVRALAGLPEGGHPLYLMTIALFVLLFGLGYLWTAIAGRADRLFITLAAAGKLAFFTLLVWFWAMGVVSIRAPLSGFGDLIFGILFVVWLYDSAR